MKEIIDWLVSIEALAARVYEKAISYFKNDKELSSLIKRLLEDEKVHFHIISRAVELTKVDWQIPCPIRLDKEGAKTIENYFLQAEQKMDLIQHN